MVLLSALTPISFQNYARNTEVGSPACISTEARSDASVGKVRRSSKSMGHIVDNVCKHKMLRLGFFPLDRRLAKCNQAFSRDIFISY